MYARIINGTLELAPNPLVTEWVQIFNPSASQLEESGYKLVVDSEQPPAADGCYFVGGWAEQDGQIVRTWTQTAIPAAEPTTEQRIAALEAVIAAQAEALAELGVTV